MITKIELRCWKTKSAIENQVRELIAASNILELSDEVVEECIKIRRTKKVKTPDAIIAATAIVYGYTIITSNVRDFADIKGLKMINPQTLV